MTSTAVPSPTPTTPKPKPTKGGPIKKVNDWKTFMIEFMMGGVAAAISKTIAAPI
jgi:hypothetical protein